jgi:hypothetical protein
LNGALGQLQSGVEGGVAVATEQLGGAAQQGLAALAGVAQSNDELAGSLSSGFSSAMSQIAGSDNFAAPRDGFNQIVEQTTTAGTEALGQVVEVMSEGCDATMSQAEETLDTSYTQLEENLRQGMQGLECDITSKADEAASHEAPAWKLLVAILLIIIVIVIIIVVTVLTAGGALAGLAAAIGPIAAGALVGAAVGAVTAGLIAAASDLWNNRALSASRIGHAMLIGAITGAIGGGIGAGVGVALKGFSLVVQYGAAMALAGGMDVVTQFVLGGFSFKHFSWGNLGLTLLITALTLGLAHAVSAPRPGAPTTEGGPAGGTTTEEGAPVVAAGEEGAPVTTPAEEGGPVAAPAEEGGPVAAPAEEGGPVAAPAEEGGPVAAPAEEGGPVAAPAEEGGPVAQPEEGAPAPAAETEGAAGPRRVLPGERGYDGPWPPPGAEGPKPPITDPNAFNWRYQRYLRQQYEAGANPADVLTPEGYRAVAFKAASSGGRPGRSGGTAQQTTRRTLASDEGVANTETTQLGTRTERGQVKANMVDGVQPVEGQPGKNNYFEVDDILSNGLPRSDMRAKLKAELPHLTEGESLVYVDKNNPSRRITYRAGEDPSVVDTRRAPPLPRRPRGGR